MALDLMGAVVVVRRIDNNVVRIIYKTGNNSAAERSPNISVHSNMQHAIMHTVQCTQYIQV